MPGLSARIRWYASSMSRDPVNVHDADLPNISREAVAGYRNAPAQCIAEVIAGVLSVVPRPLLGHATAVSALGEELGPPFRRGRGGPGGWLILDEPELWLGLLPDIVVPDLAGWRRERLPAGFIDAAHATLAPDWICEVLSPSTEGVDRGTKLELYHRETVRNVWLVSPALRSLEVFRRADIGWQLLAVFRGDAPVRAEPFDAVPLDLAALWTA